MRQLNVFSRFSTARGLVALGMLVAVATLAFATVPPPAEARTCATKAYDFGGEKNAFHGIAIRGARCAAAYRLFKRIADSGFTAGPRSLGYRCRKAKRSPLIDPRQWGCTKGRIRIDFLYN
jgi:hypothetical protein